LNNATAKGITAIADAYVFERDLDDWQEFKQQGKLDLHTKLFFKGNLGDAVLTPPSEILGYYENYDLPGEPGVKMAMGGMLESRTSAMLNDGYLDGSQAPLLIPPAEFAAYMKALDEAGIQVKVHAVGDGSIRATMEGFIAGFEKRGSNELRHHIDHCMYPNADDMKIMAEKGIPCSAWPVISAPVGFVMAHAGIIKPEAFAQVTPTRDLIDSGVLAANHTDAPQANLWPWFGMEASITRKFPGEPEIEPLNVNQAITLEESIIVHTINGAKVLLLNDVTGSIEEGKSADMIVLNHNLFDIPVTEIHETQVLTTVFKGEVVHNVELSPDSRN
jgi:predicted amidohydrolase YtcJ